MRLLHLFIALLPTFCSVQGVGYRYRANPVTGEKILVMSLPGGVPVIQTEFDNKKGALTSGSRRNFPQSSIPIREGGSYNEIDNDVDILANYKRPNNFGGERRPPIPQEPSFSSPPQHPPPFIPPPQPPQREIAVSVPPPLFIPFEPPPLPVSNQGGYVYTRPKIPFFLPGESSLHRPPILTTRPPPFQENFGIGQNSEENKDLLGKRPGPRQPQFPTRFPPRPNMPEQRPPNRRPPPRPEFGPDRETAEFPSRRPGGNQGSFGSPGDNSIGGGGSRDRDSASNSGNRNQGGQSFNNQGNRREEGERFRPADRNRPPPPGDRETQGGRPPSSQSDREQGTKFSEEERRTESEKRFEERENEFHSGNRFDERERERERERDRQRPPPPPPGNRNREREQEEERTQTTFTQTENRFDSREEERRRISSSGSRGSGGDRGFRPDNTRGSKGPPRRPFAGNEIDTEEKRFVKESKSSMSSFNSQESSFFSSSSSSSNSASQGSRQGSSDNFNSNTNSGSLQSSNEIRNDKDATECGANGEYEYFSHRLGKCISRG